MLNSEEIRRRKVAKKTTQLNLFLLGRSGAGKTTFLRNLVSNSNNINNSTTSNNINTPVDNEFSTNEKNEIDPSYTHLEQPLNFQMESIYLSTSPDVSPISLNITKTDIMNQLNNSNTPKRIKVFIQEKFDLYLENEIKIQRNESFKFGLNDSRIHVCLYFVDKELGELDIDILKEIHHLVNLFVVINKADRFNDSELKYLKSKIKQDLEKHNINMFKFNEDEYSNDLINPGNDKSAENPPIEDLLPFSIICGDNCDEKSNKLVRNYGWGAVDIEDYRYSDFIILKTILLESHLQDLKDITNEVLYEEYRTRKLLKKQSENTPNPAKKLPISEQAAISDVLDTFKENKPKHHLNETNNCNEVTDDEVFYRELKEKNKIIEAYQKKIGDLEKMIQNTSQDSSPTTKVSILQ
ncbi:hypothetical protein KAFR_0E02560 [Kazachstania africana CBS 2517]|uniref:Septin-type G domain-containing protein n=1 Tax=Kazachstania africana (strain ATCC 22294 / BCRC 22015 / CBS 2517 / CECT 1963 / NBRC 1671 / NRRL Y-8276) TaxID=1071382 RepID=H2AVK9_KAZAF|nr:hypothetical protein KAFR_0E02560 [Kazachstania africana CBS 2517]CCF58409.1 hypothetical protein KAFR_0E02560 [Kazachstania africana CBS 2517]